MVQAVVLSTPIAREWNGCSMQALETRQQKANLALARILREFDRRCLHFDVNVDFKEDRLIAKGTVHFPQLADTTQAVLAGEFPDLRVETDFRVLTRDWPVRFAEVVPPSVMGFFMPDGEPNDATTELLAGQIVRLFIREGNWVLCQAPDGYLGWIPRDTLRSVSRDVYLQWVQGKRWRLLVPWDDGNKNEYRVGSEFRLTAKGRIHVPAQGPTPTPASGEVIDPSQNPLRERIIEIARSFLGVPYLWGGRTDRGLDCSGFCQVVYARVGIALPRDANQQANMGLIVGHLADFSDLTAGDLVFFMSPKTAKIYHVGISLGGDAFIHSESKCGVNESRFLDDPSSPKHPYSEGFCFGRRILV